MPKNCYKNARDIDSDVLAMAFQGGTKQIGLFLLVSQRLREPKQVQPLFLWWPFGTCNYL